MKITVYIPESQISDLIIICKQLKLSRSEVVRLSIAKFIAANKSNFESAFGLYKDNAVDGLAYQEGTRSEW